MLRDLVGDERSPPRSAPSTTPPNAELQPIRRFVSSLAEDRRARRDLSWFFADWIDADNGLPDLTIDKVFPNAAQSGNWLVAVTISNAGYAAAEVPVTVRSATQHHYRARPRPRSRTVTPRLLVRASPPRSRSTTAPSRRRRPASTSRISPAAGFSASNRTAAVAETRFATRSNCSSGPALSQPKG